MPESHHHEPAPTSSREQVPDPQDAPSPLATDKPPTNDATGGPDDDGTVGTGTSIALGCIAGTLLLVVIGLIFLGALLIVG